jgi:hypothetical protein
MHFCGNEFIREIGISVAAEVVDVLASSRMNSFPQVILQDLI